MQLSFSEEGKLSNTEVPRLTKIVHSWKTEYLGEAPESSEECVRIRVLWLANVGKILEPYPNGHNRFDDPKLAATIEEVHAAGLRGWWE